MNTTESDIIIDINEIPEVVTDDLNGEKIERLLYREGLDTKYTVGSEGLAVLEVYGENETVVLSEPWEADGVWYIDPQTVVLDKLVDNTAVGTSFPSVSTEEDVVAAIVELFDN